MFKAQPDFDSLAPTTTKGDLISRSSTGSTRLPVGSDGQLLTADSTTGAGVKWAAPGNLVVNTLAGATTLTTTNDFLLVSGTTFAITMFSPTSNSGKVVRFLKTDGFTTSISITGTGLAGVTMQTLGEQYGLVCDGATFWPFEHKTETTWASYTPTWSSAGTAPAIGNGTINGWWRRVGSNIQIRIEILSGTTTTYGSANQYTFSLPSGLSIDNSVVNSTTGVGIKGMANARNTSSLTFQTGAVVPGTSTSNVSVAQTGGNNTNWNSTLPGTWTASSANQTISLDFEAPITGWGA